MEDVIHIAAAVRFTVRDRLAGTIKIDKAHAYNIDGTGRGIKGHFQAMFDDTPVYYGKSNFYYPLSDDVGVRVGGNLRRRSVIRRRQMEKIIDWYKAYYQAGLGPQCHGYVSVILDLTLPRGGSWRRSASGAILQRIHPPAAAWEALAKGEPYDFDALDRNVHPEHTGDSYLSFRDRVIRLRRKKAVPSCRHRAEYGTKLGDIGYCVRTSRWYVLDLG